MEARFRHWIKKGYCDFFLAIDFFSETKLHAIKSELRAKVQFWGGGGGGRLFSELRVYITWLRKKVRIVRSHNNLFYFLFSGRNELPYISTSISHLVNHCLLSLPLFQFHSKLLLLLLFLKSQIWTQLAMLIIAQSTVCCKNHRKGCRHSTAVISVSQWSFWYISVRFSLTTLYWNCSSKGYKQTPPFWWHGQSFHTLITRSQLSFWYVCHKLLLMCLSGAALS